jgi:hypothetical protein
MTTITIDTPLKLKKTHFRDPLEAGEFFLKIAVQQAKKANKPRQPKKSQYQIAMEDLEAGRNVISLSDYMQKR